MKKLLLAFLAVPLFAQLPLPGGGGGMGGGGGGITTLSNGTCTTITNPTGPTSTIAVDTTGCPSHNQMQFMFPNACIGTHSGAAWSCTLPINPTGATDGTNPLTFWFSPSDGDVAAGATTLNIAGIGQKALYVKNDVTNPAANNLKNHLYYWGVYCAACNAAAGAYVVMMSSN